MQPDDDQVLAHELLEQRLGVILEGDAIDICAAMAFLEGVDVDAFVALITESIDEHANDPDVNLCVTAQTRTSTNGLLIDGCTLCSRVFI